LYFISASSGQRVHGSVVCGHEQGMFECERLRGTFRIKHTYTQSLPDMIRFVLGMPPAPPF
jgi:hypothetical protein